MAPGGLVTARRLPAPCEPTQEARAGATYECRATSMVRLQQQRINP